MTSHLSIMGPTVMRICKDHWAKIRATIQFYSIAQLGAKSGENAMEDINADLDGRERDYDPLMIAIG